MAPLIGPPAAAALVQEADCEMPRVAVTVARQARTEV